MAANVATGAGQGDATITATVGTISGSAILHVGPPVLVSIAVTPVNPSIAKGQTQTFTAMGTFSDGSQQDVTASAAWSSADTTVATMSGNVASGIGQGNSLITASVGSIMGSTTLHVGPPVLTAIAVTPDDASCAKGTTVAYTATGTFSDNSTQDLTQSASWVSSNTSVATISITGTRGIASCGGVGTTTISATVGAFSDSTPLTVTAAGLQTIDVLPVDPTTAKGTTLQFQAIGNFSDGTTQDLTTQVTWSSSNTMIASIAPSGLATAKLQGTANITATKGSVSDSSLLTVTNASLSSIAIAPLNASIAKGTTQQYTAIGTFSDGTTQDITAQVTWSSSMTGVATIVAGGLATGVATGTTQIKAQQGTVSSPVTNLTVTSAVLQSIIVKPSNPSIAKGYKLQMTATGRFSDGSTQNLTSVATWASSKGSIASVSNAANSKGLVNAKALGTVTISATFQGVTGSTTVTVTSAVLTGIAITPATSTLAVKATEQLTATGTYSDGTTLDLTRQVAWKTTNKKIVSIRQNGVATGVKKGSATISATKNGVLGTATVTVP
jgi:uncharacterized protein YjdB